MARGNVTNLHDAGNNNGNDNGGDGSKTTVQAISDREFNKLHKAVKHARAGMDSERGTIGQLISDAVQTKHLHKGAYGIFQRLDRMDDYKRAELLFHFDLYRERAKWDTSDLFNHEGDQAAE